MHRTISLLTLLALLPGCGALCPLVGFFAGRFAGDVEGDVEVDVMEGETEDEADVQIRLTPDLDLGVAPFASAVISCDDGMFMATLETTEDVDFGEFLGSLTEEAGDGHWSFQSGEAGTWDIAKME